MAKAKKVSRKARTVREGGGPGIEKVILRIIVIGVLLAIAAVVIGFYAIPRTMM